MSRVGELSLVGWVGELSLRVAHHTHRKSNLPKHRGEKSVKICWECVCDCSTHQHIIDQHINTSTHQHINTSTHQHINTSTHQHINTSAHQHINTSTHQHINTSTQSTQSNTSTHQHINTSTHQHINTSTHQHLHTSTHQYINTSTHPHINTSTHPHIHTSTPRQIIVLYHTCIAKLCQKKRTINLHQNCQRKLVLSSSLEPLLRHTGRHISHKIYTKQRTHIAFFVKKNSNSHSMFIRRLC